MQFSLVSVQVFTGSIDWRLISRYSHLLLSHWPVYWWQIDLHEGGQFSGS